MMVTLCVRPIGLQFILCLIYLIEASNIYMSWVSASSSDMLIIRHGRSRVRHSSEKNHIRWGLQAFDNLTLYDYDYEGANGTNGSNETLFDFGLNNQTFLGIDSFSYGDTSFNNSAYINANTNDWKSGSTPAPPISSSRWSTSTSTTPAKNLKLAKKQIMENIRKNVEEGIEYLRTHAHLTQPTAVMPSEKALLQLQKQAEQMSHTEKVEKLKTLSVDRLDKIELDPFSSNEQSISKHFKPSSSSSSSSSSFSIPLNAARIEHDHNQLNQKKHKADKMPLWKITHPKNTDETFGKNQINAHQFDYEMANDEPAQPTATHNENAHQSDNHQYKSNILNARRTHETTPGTRTKSIATMQTIDSIVTSINAAVSKKFNGAKSKSNATKASDMTVATRSQSSHDKRKETITQSKSSEIPVHHAIDTELLKQNDSATTSNANKNFNNQFELNSFSAPFDELNDEEQTNDDSGDDTNPLTYDSNYEQTFDGKSIIANVDSAQLPIFRMEDMNLDDLDQISRNNRLNLKRGRDVVTKFLQIVESQHLLGANCSAGTALNLGEGIVDRYAQDRFRVEAEVAVNRANMLTRIFKLSSKAVQMSEHILHASVLSMVEFDDDIYAAGHCFDWNQHMAKRGLFCPFAHRLPPPEHGAFISKDLATEYPYLGNTSEWFFLARKNAEKVIAKNDQYIKAFHLYTNSTDRETDEILSVRYEDGRWSKPYYDCGGANIWMLTYTVPFFGYENGSYFFKGTSGIDIDLRRVDIDQCPQLQIPGGNALPLNIFAGTDKCKARTTECEAISGLGFRRGSYKCVCRKGYYFPDTTLPQKYFNGSSLEEEYEKLMLGEMSLYNNANAFECLPCAEGCDACKDASPCVAALNWPMRTSILVLACAVIGFLPPAAWFTFRYQQVKVLRAASPALLRVIALGAFFIYCTSIVMYPPPSIYTCTARVWLREIGFSLTYGALMLKTWRISVVFRVRSAKAVKITDATLLKRLGIICICVGIGLLVRTIVAPPVVIVGKTADDLKAFLCKADWWDHTFTSMEVLFLAWGVRLCIMVRKAPSEFNESRFISMAIYNEFFLTCFLNVSMLFLQSPANPDLLYIIFFCHTQLTVTLLLVLIFGSKVYLVYRSGGKPPEDSSGAGVKSSGAKFICRSQARQLANTYPSTATSSTTPLGTNVEHRLTEQEANDEIRTLLQNFVSSLQSIKDRVPSRGSAMATISILLDTIKPSYHPQSSLMPPTIPSANKRSVPAITNSCADKSTNTNTNATTSNGDALHLTQYLQTQNQAQTQSNLNGSISATASQAAQISNIDAGCNEQPNMTSVSCQNAELPVGSVLNEKHSQNQNKTEHNDEHNEELLVAKVAGTLDLDARNAPPEANARELNFLHLKLQCMCSDDENSTTKSNFEPKNKHHVSDDDETDIEISDVKAVTEIGESMFENHLCSHCGRDHCCFFLRCCYCKANGLAPNETISHATDNTATNPNVIDKLCTKDKNIPSNDLPMDTCSDTNQNLARKRCDEICKIYRNQLETGLCSPISTMANQQCCEKLINENDKPLTKSTQSGCHCRWYCIKDCDLDGKSGADIANVASAANVVGDRKRGDTTLAIQEPEIVSPIANESPLNEENRLRCCRCSKELF